MAVPGPTTQRHIEQLATNLVRLACAQRQLSLTEFGAQASLTAADLAAIEDGTWQPTLPELAQILAAVDFELRITLGDYDSHDDILDADTAGRAEAQREEEQSRQDAFIADLRQARPVH